MYVYTFTFILKICILMKLKIEIEIYRGACQKVGGGVGGCEGLDPHVCLEKLKT